MSVFRCPNCGSTGFMIERDSSYNVDIVVCETCECEISIRGLRKREGFRYGDHVEVRNSKGIQWQKAIFIGRDSDDLYFCTTKPFVADFYKCCCKADW